MLHCHSPHSHVSARGSSLLFAWGLLSVVIALSPNLVAQSPVDRNQQIKVIRTDFGLADGAAASGNTLYVPDVKKSQLLAYNPASKDKKWRKIGVANGKYSGTFFQLGKLYLAETPEARLLTLENNGKLTEWIRFSGNARPNDLVVNISGYAFVTFTKEGQVRMVSPDGNEKTVAEGLTTPNGITMSPDGTRLYVSEYKTGKILQFQMDENSLKQLGMLAQIESESGPPLADGMTCDRAGNVYCAAYDAVWVFNSNGKLLDKIATKERPINCTFGGPHGLDLFISTFGGLVKQPMKSYGIQPNRVSSFEQGITARLNTVYYEDGTRKLLCDIFTPDSEELTPGIILVHGGGWLHGDKTKFRTLAMELAKLGYGVMAIEYRLGFERRFPVAVQDCNAALGFLAQNAKTLNIDHQRIAAVGGSAGGHLVGLMATGSEQPQLQPNGKIRLLAKSSRNYDSGAELAAAVVMAGPMEIASGSVAQRSVAGSQSNAINWLGQTIDEAPKLYELADAYLKISTDDPPILFIRGSLDNPQADEPSIRALKKAGVSTEQVIHEGAKHGHWNRPDWMPQVVSDIHRFLQQHLQ